MFSVSHLYYNRAGNPHDLQIVTAKFGFVRLGALLQSIETIVHQQERQFSLVAGIWFWHCLGYSTNESGNSHSLLEYRLKNPPHIRVVDQIGPHPIKLARARISWVAGMRPPHGVFGRRIGGSSGPKPCDGGLIP